MCAWAPVRAVAVRTQRLAPAAAIAEPATGAFCHLVVTVPHTAVLLALKRALFCRREDVRGGRFAGRGGP